MGFGKFPFKWADDEQTVDDTIAARKVSKRMGPPIKDFLVPTLLLFGFVAVAWLYFAGRSKPEPEAEAAARLEPSQLTATALALAPVATPTAMPSLIIPSPTASPTPWLTPTPLVTKTPLFARVVSATLSTPVVVDALARSPLPTPPAVVEAVFVSPVLPTPTPSPYDYLVLGYTVGPETEKIYSYVSGWIVEPDGTTPRPIGVELCHPSACMTYPRPNNTDIASGYYEFLVSPGVYRLAVRDTKSPVVQLEVGDHERHEVSFQLTTDRPLAQKIISSPWNGEAPSAALVAHGSLPPTPAPTVAPLRLIYLPAIFRGIIETNRLYLPLMLK